MSHLFVCQTTLELTAFEQQLCSTTQMHYNWVLAAAKKGMWPLSIAYIEQKSSVTLGRVN